MSDSERAAKQALKFQTGISGALGKARICHEYDSMGWDELIEAIALLRTYWHGRDTIDREVISSLFQVPEWIYWQASNRLTQSKDRNALLAVMTKVRIETVALLHDSRLDLRGMSDWRAVAREGGRAPDKRKVRYKKNSKLDKAVRIVCDSHKKLIQDAALESVGRTRGGREHLVEAVLELQKAWEGESFLPRYVTALLNDLVEAEFDLVMMEASGTRSQRKGNSSRELVRAVGVLFHAQVGTENK